MAVFVTSIGGHWSEASQFSFSALGRKINLPKLCHPTYMYKGVWLSGWTLARILVDYDYDYYYFREYY